MTALLIIILGFAILALITYNWVKGIEYMHINHPDYKGEDFLGEDVDTK
jgi:hypothetical protein